VAGSKDALADGQRLSVGITFPSDAPFRHILFRNAIAQNCLVLCRALASAGHSVRLVVASLDRPDHLPPPTMVACTTLERIIGGVEPLDVIIEVALNAERNVRQLLKQRFGTVVLYLSLGASLPIDMEEIFVREAPRLTGVTYVSGYVDCVLTSPHLAYQVPFLENLYRTECRIFPYLWSPRIGVIDPAHRYQAGDFRARDSRPNLYCLEPNVNVLKNCLVPLLAVDRLCRDGGGDLFGKLYVHNSGLWARSPYWMQNYVKNVPCIQSSAGKVELVGRAPVERIFRSGRPCPGLVISSTWHCSLNYLFLELAHKGVPLVHSSEMLASRGAGYAYDAFDCTGAAARLRQALDEFESASEQRRDGYDTLLAAYDADSRENIARVDSLLRELYEQYRSD